MKLIEWEWATSQMLFRVSLKKQQENNNNDKFIAIIIIIIKTCCTCGLAFDTGDPVTQFGSCCVY